MMLYRILSHAHHHLCKASGCQIICFQRKVIGQRHFSQSSVKYSQACRQLIYTIKQQIECRCLSANSQLRVLSRTLTSDTTEQDKVEENKTQIQDETRTAASNPEESVKKRSLLLTIEVPSSDVPPEILSVANSKRLTYTVTDKETGQKVNFSEEPYIFRKKTEKAEKQQPAAKTSFKYIDKIRAKEDYCLTDTDLKGLITLKKRSPYTGTPFITLYRTVDIQKKAVEIWGSLEAVEFEKLRRQNSIPFWLGDFRHQQSFKKEHEEKQKKSSLYAFVTTGTGKVIAAAFLVNAVISCAKWHQWYCSTSVSILAEAIHSTLDTLNQIMLGIGAWKSLAQPDEEHPYGYSYVRYVTSLVSSLCFFSGSVLNFYNGAHGIYYMSSFDTDYTKWSVGLLLSCAVLESGALNVAYQQVKASLKANGQTPTLINLSHYVWNAVDPNVAIVLLEDSVAVLGNLLAMVTIFLSNSLSEPRIDAAGSLVVGALMMASAAIIFKSNMDVLIGRSISEKQKKEMVTSLESDEAVRSVHDVKAIDLGEKGGVRLKAEIDYNGEVITKELLEDLLENRELWMELDEIRGCPEEQREFLIKFGGQVVDKLGMETDRIEENLKMKHKNIRHIDLESL